MAVSMKDVIDMHVHSAPDLRVRAYNDFELMEAGIRVGARAIVIKSHEGITADRAYLCNLHNQAVHGDSNCFTMYGGITLNRAVGGLNPWAVENALKLGAKVVWLPTQSAGNHLIKAKSDARQGIEVVRDGKVVSALEDIFRLVKDYDAVLATGHISPEEAFVVVEDARRTGVQKIVITHPEWWLVGMSVEEQLRLVKDYGVILERCYAQNMGDQPYKSNLADNLELIRTVGYQNVLVSTDGGQVENPRWEMAYQEYMQYLADHGIPEEHIYHMTRILPARLLGVELQSTKQMHIHGNNAQ